MRECKDCRHYRNPLQRRLIASYIGEFALCMGLGCERARYAEVARKYKPPVGCGPSAARFEPLPLGRSHGIDWDRAVKIADIQAQEREIDEAHRLLDELYELGKEFERATALRHDFTVAEYLAALTTDYDPPVRVAAE